MPPRRVATPRETFDDPWKQIVPALFEQFLAFFAPEVAADIDWQRAPEFLVKVRRKDGDEPVRADPYRVALRVV
jgi:hypothetical protein